jgi:molecular chaperone GrpE
MEDNRTDLDINFNDASESAGATTGETPAADAARAGSSDVERQRDEYRDLLLRKSAEFDNYRKRTERDRQMLADAAAADLLSELLPLVDDLERALQADTRSEGTDAYRRGVELIHKQLSETLRKRGVRPLESLGADFDPHYHQAVAHEPASGHREGEIVEEYRRGYMLGDRLLRPSMVKVAKGEA